MKLLGGKFKFIDLFAGIGGIRLSFQNHKGHCVFTSEWDKFAQKTYNVNFGDEASGDIQKILSKKTVDSITKMLKLAVDDGTGSRARVPHFKIAGKTSTAQRIDSEGKYSGYIAGFLGYPIGVNKKFVV